MCGFVGGEGCGAWVCVCFGCVCVLVFVYCVRQCIVHVCVLCVSEYVRVCVYGCSTHTCNTHMQHTCSHTFTCTRIHYIHIHTRIHAYMRACARVYVCAHRVIHKTHIQTQTHTRLLKIVRPMRYYSLLTTPHRYTVHMYIRVCVCVCVSVFMQVGMSV